MGGDELESNPFSTRWIRPGAIDYRFSDGQDAQQLVTRLARWGWQGQIVGVHGSGKSSLVRALFGPIEAAGRRIDLVTLTQNERWWMPSRDRVRSWNERTLVIVDGYEQLGMWSRWRLRAVCRRRGSGLLVTSHQDVGFSEVASTKVSLAMAQAIVSDLQRAGPVLVQPDDVLELFAAQNGNFRETLFGLYDLYEMRRRRD